MQAIAKIEISDHEQAAIVVVARPSTTFDDHDRQQFLMTTTIDDHDHLRFLMTTKIDDHDRHHLVQRTRSTITIIAISYHDHDRRSRSMAAVYFSLRTTTIDDHDLQK